MGDDHVVVGGQGGDVEGGRVCALVFRVPGCHGGGMPLRDRLLAALVAVLWGANFLAIHVGLQHFPPLFLAALRFAVIALPTVLFVPRPQVRLRWLIGYGLGFGTLQFLSPRPGSRGCSRSLTSPCWRRCWAPGSGRR